MLSHLKIILFIAALLSAFLGAGKAAAQAEAQPSPLELKNEVDLSYLEHYWQELEREAGDYLPRISWRDFLSAPGEQDLILDPGAIIGGLGRYLLGEVVMNFRLMGQLLVLAVIAAFLKKLETAFQREQIATLTRSIVFVVLIGIGLHSFSAALWGAGATIDMMADFILAMLPTLLALLASLGSLASSAIFHPLVIFGVSFFGSLIRNLILPLIFLSAVLGLVNQFSPHFKVGKLADLMRDLSIWGMGLIMTLFTGILAVQGVAGTVSDAVTLRTAKYMTGAFVPVVGKMLSDAVETVAGASLILKNGIYLAGTVLLLLMTVFPLLKLAALIVVYKLTAALVQPLGEENLGDAINVMGNCLGLVFAAVAAVSLLFIIAVTVVVGAGNITVMFR